MPAPTPLEREILARLDALEAKAKPKAEPKADKPEAKSGPRGGIGV
jgi:hypothetical protein